MRAYTIMIIDDDPQVGMALKHILTRRQYKVLTTISAVEALDVLQHEKPDLFLMDVIMPGMDGYQLCRTLKREDAWRQIPVIFLTAANQTTDLVKGFEAGAVDFISKPFNKAELLARVQTHIELKESRDIIYTQNQRLHQEVEQRKQTEEKFRALSQTAFEGVLFLKDNAIIEANHAACLLLGLDESAIEGTNFQSFLDEAAKEVIAHIRQGDATSPTEVVLHDAFGNKFFGMVQVQRIQYKGDPIDVLAIRDISLQKEMERQLVHAIIDTEEKERRRFSRDLHDGLGAVLSTLKIYVNMLQKDNRPETERKEMLREMRDTINEAVQSTRTIANNIMPGVLSDFGLIKALESFCNMLSRSDTLVVDFQYSEPFGRLDQNLEINLYRITLELINNTLKHAQASRIRIRIQRTEQKVLLDYEDNGRGFNFGDALIKEGQHDGLKNIQNRAIFMNARAQFRAVMHSPTGTGFSLSVDL